MDKKKVSDYLQNEELPCTLINIILTKEFTPGWLNWEIESIDAEITEAFGVDLSQLNREKLQALSVLLTTNSYYNQWEAFENINNALNDQHVDFEVVTPNEPEHLVWGLLEAIANDEDVVTLSQDVKDYIETVFKVNGLCKTPKAIQNIVSYTAHCTFDKEEERRKQMRISTYCALQLKKIEQMARELEIKPLNLSEVYPIKDLV